MDVLVFDDAVGAHSYLHRLLSLREHSPLLKSFLDRVTSALRTDISNSPRLQRQYIPALSNLHEFLGAYQKTTWRSAPVDNALLCIAQLAHWIGTAEECTDLLSADLSILASGVGLLTAAAVSSFSSAATCVPAAVEIVRVAFRLGLHIDCVSDRLRPRGQDEDIWAIHATGISEIVAKCAIEDFNEQTALSIPNQAYISSINQSGVTISGPPRTLQRLFESSDCLKNSENVSMPLLGPYNAPHLHNEDSIPGIIGMEEKDVVDLFTSSVPTIPIFSTSQGTCYQASSLVELLPQVFEDILLKRQNFHLAVHECVEKVSSHYQSCRVVPVGPASSPASVVSALQSKPSLNVALLEHEVGQAQAGRQNSPGVGNSKIAIVGMSGRFPGAQDIEEFWEVLQKGLDMHKEVPLDRFDPKTHVDPTGKTKNTSHTPFGCFIENAGLFDPRFFNMSPREAAQTDPMQRLALVTAYEALEMTGYVPNRTPSTKLDRIGTFYGQTSDDWREINEAQDIDTYFITGGVRAFGPGRINYHFKFSGPSFSVDTACSSSMAAIQLACTSLWAGDCDTAVCGGVNVMTNPDIFAGLSRGQFLSKVGPCQTFDNDADGYCRGDGVGTVILKRLEDAEADKDNILAVILSSATNHSAEAISITHPHDKTQEILYRKVLDQAGVDALDVDMVEMHGTGTQAGDGTEMRSVTNVFAPADRLRLPHQKLYIGSVKANIGHGEAASGVTALIKSLMVLRKNAIPPHVGIKGQINQGFPKDLAARNVHIAFQQAAFPRKKDPRLVFVNNFSAAGGNSAVLLEDGPIRRIQGNDARQTHVVSVSARALSSLKGNLTRLAKYLDETPNVSLPNLGYTTTARRIHHNYRIAFPATDVKKLRSALLAAAETDIAPQARSPPVAFTFTGQGSHYASLGAELFETCSQFQSDLIYFDSLATSLGFVSFLPLVDGSVDDVSTLSPLLVQVGLSCIQMALSRLWASWGVKPDVVIGHSLGEYAALNAAGVLSVCDTIFLVGERAKLLESRCTAGSHAMLAVKAGVTDVADVLKDGKIEVACINGPVETVLSGAVSDIDVIKNTLEARGLKTTKLNVPYAFHSSQVDAILPEFERIAASVDYSDPTITLLSPLLSSSQTAGQINAAYLGRHARETVNFVGALKAGQEDGVISPNTVFVEIGPHPVTLGFVKSTLGNSIQASGSLRRNEAPWTTLASTACNLHNQGVDIDWNEYHRDFDDCHELLELPAYSWALKNYWIDYKNDWCLTKGTDAPVARLTAATALSTTSVQKVIEESYSNGKGTLVAESDVSRPDLYAAISGHLVNGAALCPSSIYGDVGVTIGQHMYRQMWNLPSDAPIPGVNVRDMEVPKPLIAKPGVSQILKMTAHADKNLGHVDLVFTTGSTVHAKCTIEYGDHSSWLSEWQRTSYMVEQCIDSLLKQGQNGQSHTLLQGMAYKLFTALVQYEDSYRGMQRVVLDGKNLEATAEVICQPLKDGQTFVCPPYWIDSIGHLAGFIMNANDEVDSKTQVYVSHGWESLRFSQPLVQGKSYRTYVRMLPAEGKMVAGDVYLFDGKTVVGVIGGLKFQCIPRKVLDTLLPPPGVVARPAMTATQEVKATDETIRDQFATKENKKVEKTQKTERKGSSTKTPTITSQVMEIIADECGVDMSELADGNSFPDLGVDSLMQLAISGRMREHLELEVHSTLFSEYPSVGALKGYLDSLSPPTDGEEDETADDENSDVTSSTWSGGTRQCSLTSPESPRQMPEDVYSHDKVSRALENLRGQELGVDSDGFSKGISMDFKIKEISAPMTPTPKRHATSVILQGSPKTATQNFFLFPDGGGSATSYVLIPDLSPTTCVYGMNSPYMKTPEEYTCGVPGMAEAFVTEIRRRQPHGPYNLGGWSAGGVIAYEGANQLINAGETVARLILIDAPCPLIIEPLPSSLHRWFNEIGLLGDPKTPNAKVPSWLLPHFQASIDALSTYNVRSIDKAKAPKTFAIWCRDGVCKEPTDPRPDPYPYGHAQWLLENRTDFGPNLWDAMVGPDNVTTSCIDGNHFSMMKMPHVQSLRDEIYKALTTEV